MSENRRTNEGWWVSLFVAGAVFAGLELIRDAVGDWNNLFK
jgi:hypothetical protein